MRARKSAKGDVAGMGLIRAIWLDVRKRIIHYLAGQETRTYFGLQAPHPLEGQVEMIHGSLDRLLWPDTWPADQLDAQLADQLDTQSERTQERG
jgi:hypothetical protein